MNKTKLTAYYTHKSRDIQQSRTPYAQYPMGNGNSIYIKLVTWKLYDLINLLLYHLSGRAKREQGCWRRESEIHSAGAR